MAITEIFQDEKKRWKGQKHIFANAPKNYIQQAERIFLQDMFDSLPIEKRKELLGFSIINPFDVKKPESSDEADYRERLRLRGHIEFNCEIII